MPKPRLRKVKEPPNLLDALGLKPHHLRRLGLNEKQKTPARSQLLRKRGRK